jgi:PAS domain S-box-containing protein
MDFPDGPAAAIAIGGTVQGSERHGRRQHDRLIRPGRRHGDARLPVAEQRRVLCVGSQEHTRLLYAYLFEEAGYVVYAAADERQAVAFSRRLLPDVVVLEMEGPAALSVCARLASEPSTFDIPVVVLTSSLDSPLARQAHALGAVPIVSQPTDLDAFIGEVDTLIAAAPRAQRALKRRLLDLQELARTNPPDSDGQTVVRQLIDRLQVAILAVDEQGHCVAASQGASTLTGYSRPELLAASVFQLGLSSEFLSYEGWLQFLAHRHYASTTTIANRAGESIRVHAVALAKLMPGVHVAAFALAEGESRRSSF